MVHFGKNIYCTSSVIEEIKSRARTGTAVASLLMTGVFNPRKILNCTFTGRGIMNQGKAAQNRIMQPLNNVAKDLIIGKHRL